MPGTRDLHHGAPGVMNMEGRAITPVKSSTAIQTRFASDQKSSDDRSAMNVAIRKRAATPCTFLHATTEMTSANTPARRTLGSRLCRKPDRRANLSDTSASESACAKLLIVL